MNGYTKLFGSIIASTVWRESKETKIVWITMLALANKNGIIEASIPGLADLARVSIEEIKVALNVLSSADEYSRTQEFEGRRIQSCDGGWKILNHAKYRAKMNADERRDYLRVKQQEHRAKLSTNESTKINNCQKESTPSTHAEAEAEAKKSSSAKVIHLSDEEFTKSLEANGAYSHINIRVELGKMDAWLLTKPGRRKTKRFVLNWLNKIEVPMSKTIEMQKIIGDGVSLSSRSSFGGAK